MPIFRLITPSSRAAVAPLLIAAAAVVAMPAAAAPATRFEPQLQVAGAPLVLNGAGTRFKGGLFKVYDLALYTPRKVETAAEVLALPGAKRLQFTALRELPGTELGRLFLKGMGDNASKELMTKHVLASTRLIEVFSGRAKLVPGDTFAMDFVPGKGTTFYIAGQPQGAPVGDEEFFKMVLGIWFGEKPADATLRDALLGKETS